MPSLMVIDDDRSVLHLIKSTFQGTDVNVVTASSAAEGLALLGRQQQDAVLLDMSLLGN